MFHITTKQPKVETKEQKDPEAIIKRKTKKYRKEKWGEIITMFVMP